MSFFLLISRSHCKPYPPLCVTLMRAIAFLLGCFVCVCTSFGQVGSRGQAPKKDTLVVQKTIVYKDSLYEKLVEIQAKLDAANSRIDSFYDHIAIIVGLIGVIAALVVIISYGIIKRNAGSEVDTAIKTVNDKLKEATSEVDATIKTVNGKLVEYEKEYKKRVDEFDLRLFEGIRQQTESSLKAKEVRGSNFETNDLQEGLLLNQADSPQNISGNIKDDLKKDVRRSKKSKRSGG